MAKSLEKKLCPRSVLLLVCDTSLETASLYFCALRIGVVPILLDSKVGFAYLEETMTCYRPQFVWIKRNCHHEKLHSCCKEYLGFKDHLLYETDYKQYEIYDDLAIVLTTSGTTGSQKMVRISYENIVHNTRMVNEILEISSYDRGITSLPFHHSLGLLLLHSLWMANGSLVLYEGTVLNPDYLNLIDRYKATITFLVPYSVDMLNMTDTESSSYGSLRCVMVGGEKQSDKLRNRWIEFCNQHKIRSVFGYGQTEGSGYISCIDLQNQKSLDHVGIPHSHIEAWLEETNDQNIGELVIKSDSVSLGYANDWRDLIKEDENKGILRTGDLAYIDEAGNIFITGRKKRIVKILGERISLDDIETILRNALPNCNYACIEMNGSLNVICDSNLVSDNEIFKAIEDASGIHKKMIRIIRIKEFPRLDNGKIDYISLRSKACHE